MNERECLMHRKKCINGIIYDTGKAKLIHQYSYIGLDFDFIKHHEIRVSYYMGEKGRVFKVKEYRESEKYWLFFIKRTIKPEHRGEFKFCYFDTDITKNQMMDELYGKIDPIKFEIYFGKIEEA
jgi:hypothetical protein